MALMTTQTYNGWANYATWNASLWINNDPFLYSLAKECCGFTQFKQALKCAGGDGLTPDGAKWDDADYPEIQSMFNELILETL